MPDARTSNPLFYRRILRFCLIATLSFIAVLEAKTNNDARLAKANRAFEALKKRPTNTKLREQTGQLFFQSGKPDKCVEVLRPYSNQISDSSKLILSDCLDATKKYVDQITILTSLTQTHPNNTRMLYKLGKAHQNNKDLDQATVEYRKALKANEKFLPAHKGLMSVFVETENHYETRELLKELIRIYGSRPEFLHHLCERYSKDGFLKETLQTCNSAIKRNPKTSESYVYLALAYVNQDQEHKAEEVLVKAAGLFPKSSFVQTAAGNFYLKSKNYPVARRYYLKATQGDVPDADAFLGLAECSLELKQYGPALNAFEAACKKDRKASNPFREAATRVRQMGAGLEWQSEFTSKSLRCRLSQPLK